ncbi:MAG: sulfite exporter TauE/SafE family protein [Candidatus Methanoperedenaceae archaeon]|nr:MAG: sulfite exporter TauE/SafE family protein [Candidatus Methanoperedenaceae archaeon]
MEIIPVIAIAFMIAVLFSVLGLGGAIIYTPLFFWLGIPLLAAIPMALLLNMVTTASASITYLKQQLVDKRIAYPMILASIAGALIGSYLASRVETRIIILLLSVILLIAALRILFFSNLGFRVKDGKNKKIFIGTGLAFIFGIISSLVGIGGGTFIVPLLLIIGLEIKNAAATSAFIITFTSFSGFAGHLVFGAQTLDIRVLFYTGLAVFAGAQIGSKMIFKRVSSKNISNLFALVLLFVAGKLLYGLI